MIPDDKVLDAQGLIADGHNDAQVASRTGLSRGTVRRIRAGIRKPGHQIKRKRAPYNEKQVKGGIIRCPTCGGLVYAPCRVCALRAKLAN